MNENDSDEVRELREKVRELTEKLDHVRREIIYFRDHPGCNPGRRRLALRRLLWSVGADEDTEE
jgi:hypothetical protein